MPKSAAIVGGGISGLATAYFLARRGIRPVIFEKNSRLGGLIQTDRIRGCVLEAGPDSYLASKRAVTELAEELPALQGQTVESNDAARRIFVARRGELVPMPKGMVMMVPGDWATVLRSELLSAGAKARLMGELLQRPTERAQDISVGQFVEEHFGRELLEYVAEPLLSGVYGGDVASLSARSVLPRFVSYEAKYGSLIRGVRDERRHTAQTPLFRSFRDGMQTLTDALASRIEKTAKIVQAEVTAVEPDTEGWRLHAGAESVFADMVVLACAAYVNAALLERSQSQLAGQLGAIPYSSAILVTLVWDRSRLSHPLDGFGFLVPRSERKTIAAATWVSTKFPNRTPSKFAAIRAFIVGQEATNLMNGSDEDIVYLVRSDLDVFMGLEAGPEFFTVYRWPRSMPQYIVGHGDRLKNISELISKLPGLYLVGNSYDGVGIPDCVRLAGETAGQIADIAYR